MTEYTSQTRIHLINSPHGNCSVTNSPDQNCSEIRQKSSFYAIFFSETEFPTQCLTLILFTKELISKMNMRLIRPSKMNPKNVY